MKPPRVRREGLLTTKLDDEVVVYDPERKQVHSLNRVAVAVWSYSDSTKTIEELQQLASDAMGAPIAQAAVMLALRKLERAHLLTEKLEKRSSLTRREVLDKAGRYGAAAMTTPLIASALVPVAAAAQSLPGGVCRAGTCNSVQRCGQTVTHVSCFCWSLFGGGSICSSDFFCNPGLACGPGNTCPANNVCADTCCGATCISLDAPAACEPFAPAHVLAPLRGGSTASGGQ